MKKYLKIFPLLMVIVMTFSIFPTFVFAETGDTFTAETMSEAIDEPVTVSYEVLTEDASGGTVAVTRQGTNPAVPQDTTFLILPDTVTNNGKTYTVTEIGESAFEGCTSLYLISLPSSLTKIGERAFAGCTDLLEINIPDSVTDIGDNAFKDCSEPYWIKSTAKTPAQLGEDVFVNCSSFTIQIPNGTKQAYIDAGWPEDSLYESSFLQGTINDTYSKPIEGATVSFYNNKNGNFKGSVTTDENGYFDATNCVEYGNEYIAKIEKSGYMATNMEFEVLWGVNSISYIISLANANSSFSANTVEGAPITYQILTKDETSRTGTVRIVYGPGPVYGGTLTLPSSVTYDGICYTVTEIGYGAFNTHQKVTQIILPSYLEKIEGESLFNCLSLNCVISNNYNPPEMINNAGYTGWGVITVIIPLGTKQAYIDADFAIDDTDFQEIEFSSLSGKVVDENGNGVADAKVTIYNDNGYQESVYTDSDGRYCFNDYLLNSEFVNSYVENGCHNIRVEKAGYKESIANIDLAESDVTGFNIVMTSLYPNVPEDDNLPDSPTPTPSTLTPNSPSIPTNTNSSNDTNTAQTSINNNPQMGDNSLAVYLAFGCMLIAIIASGILTVRKKS